MDERQRGPRVVVLLLTSRCDARCVMCRVWTRPAQDIDLDVASRIASSCSMASSIRYLTLSGGEPTLHPQLHSITELLLAPSTGLQEIVLSTNALDVERTVGAAAHVLRCIGGRRIRFVAYVSLDAVGATHDEIRGRTGAFDCVERTISELKRLFAVWPLAELRINCVITKLNADGIGELLHYSDHVGVPVNISVASRTDSWIGSAACKAEWELGTREATALRHFLRRAVAVSRLMRGRGAEPDYVSELLRVLEGQVRTLPCPFREHMGCFIEPWGDVYVCGMSREARLGSLSCMSLENIWKDACTWDRVLAGLSEHCRSCLSNCYVQVGSP